MEIILLAYMLRYLSVKGKRPRRIKIDKTIAEVLKCRGEAKRGMDVVYNIKLGMEIEREGKRKAFTLPGVYR